MTKIQMQLLADIKEQLQTALERVEQSICDLTEKSSHLEITLNDSQKTAILAWNTFNDEARACVFKSIEKAYVKCGADQHAADAHQIALILLKRIK